jgi:hypothetical protein
MFRAFRTLLRWIFTPFIALLLIFEEWGWEPLARLFARLAQLPLWARLEAAIGRLPPWGALLVLLVPTSVLFPVKLLALYFIGRGQATLGVAVLLLAKLLGTALLARLFQVTQPALMQMPWFAQWYPRWKAWKDALMAQMRHSKAWRWAKGLKESMQRTLRAALGK